MRKKRRGKAEKEIKVEESNKKWERIQTKKKRKEWMNDWTNEINKWDCYIENE